MIQKSLTDGLGAERVTVDKCEEDFIATVHPDCGEDEPSQTVKKYVGLRQTVGPRVGQASGKVGLKTIIAIMTSQTQNFLIF